MKILQIGLGPLGQKIFQYIHDRQTIDTVAAVDIQTSLIGKDLGELCERGHQNIPIKGSLREVDRIDEIDAVVLTTSSELSVIAKQIYDILDYNIPIVSTCEELCYPWVRDPQLAHKIDQKAKEKNVAVVSTGVNPGFLMDTLPAMLTGVCNKVTHITVNRVQDAQTRRLPFQKKIGAGLDLAAFKAYQDTGKLRHVGLAESMNFIAKSVGWKLDQVDDQISPVIAEKDIHTPSMDIKKGDAMGVRQIGTAFYAGKEKIKLYFEACVGSGVSYDEVKIQGEPNLHSRIEGGVHGDIATCSIVINTLPNILISKPGLQTMRDLPIVSFIQ